jgi:hypothetical protein
MIDMIQMDDMISMDGMIDMDQASSPGCWIDQDRQLVSALSLILGHPRAGDPDRASGSTAAGRK